MITKIRKNCYVLLAGSLNGVLVLEAVELTILYLIFKDVTAVSLTNFRSILIFASCVVGTRICSRRWYLKQLDMRINRFPTYCVFTLNWSLHPSATCVGADVRADVGADVRADVRADASY